MNFYIIFVKKQIQMNFPIVPFVAIHNKREAVVIRLNSWSAIIDYNCGRKIVNPKKIKIIKP